MIIYGKAETEHILALLQGLKWRPFLYEADSQKLFPFQAEWTGEKKKIIMKGKKKNKNEITCPRLKKG